MSLFNRSLVFEEIKEPEDKFVDLLPIQHLSISNISIGVQPANQVVKVTGNIIVSF